MASIDLLQAVAVTAELCGRTFSEGAARVFVDDLSAYPEAATIKALARCRREVRGVLTVQDVVSRLDDGRPGVEEAWAGVPYDESQSVVWTSEMAEAYGCARRLLDEGDKVGARMAFKEAYLRLIADARDLGKPVRWEPSLGYDQHGRWQALQHAVAQGRIGIERAREELPGLTAPAPAIEQLLIRSEGRPFV